MALQPHPYTTLGMLGTTRPKGKAVRLAQSAGEWPDVALTPVAAFLGQL